MGERMGGRVFQDGRHFGATFELLTSMADERTLVGNFDGGVQTLFCGIKLGQTMRGSAGIFGAQGRFKLKMGGLMNVQRGLELDEVEVESADLTYDTMDVALAEEHEGDQTILTGEAISYVQNVVGTTSEAPLG